MKILGDNKENQKTPGKRKILYRIVLSLLLLVILLVVILVALWLMILHQPAGYQPRRLSREYQVQVEEEGKDKFTNMYNDIQRLEPFKVSYNQQLINDLLMLDDVQAGYKQRLSEVEEYFKYAQFVFDKGRIFLMGQVSLESINTVITITFAPSITAEGQLEIDLESIKAGALRLPESLVQEQLEKVVEFIEPGMIDLGTLNHYYLNDKELAHDWAGLLQVLISQQKVSMEAVMRTMDDKQVRIEDIHLSEGNLELTLTPTYIGK